MKKKCGLFSWILELIIQVMIMHMASGRGVSVFSICVLLLSSIALILNLINYSDWKPTKILFAQLSGLLIGNVVFALIRYYDIGKLQGGIYLWELPIYGICFAPMCFPNSLCELLQKNRK